MSPEEKQRAVNALARKDFPTFARLMFEETGLGAKFHNNWHLDSIAHHLEEVTAGRCKRLLITIPPRSMKSTICSVLYPAYLLGRDPSKRIICASYSDELARTFSRRCRDVMRHPRYKKLFPRTLISPTKDSEKEFETTKLGFRFSTSVGGTLTGRGASLIIVDDPMSTNDADSETFLARTETWCRETLLSRLDNKKDDAIILIMQRLHPEDLAGVALKMGGWKHLNLPAIAEQTHDVILDSHHFYRRTPGHVLFPERESKETLEKIKREMGTRAFAAQYQQSPVPADGNLIKVSWLQRYRAPLEINFDDKIMISCDTAQSGKDIMGASYSVIMRCVIRGDDVYINDVIRGRWEYPELKRRVREQYYRFHREASGFELVIENKGSGLSLIQDLKEEHIRAMPMEPDGDKVVRASKHTARIERGCLHLPDEAPWLGDFIDELRAFPSGRYDDQVDALSQVFERAFYPIRRGRAGTSGARGTI